MEGLLDDSVVSLFVFPSQKWSLVADESTKLAAAAVNASHASSQLTFEVPPVNINQPLTKHQKKLRRSSLRSSGHPASRKAVRLKHLEQAQESRRHLLTSICAKFQPGVGASTLTQWHLSRLFVVDRYKLLYCEVPKAGCSNWKRVMMVLSGSAITTRDIPHDTAHYSNSLRLLRSYNRTGVTQRLHSYTKVLFVREPFERLVSAFRDKFESPNAYYHSVFGRPIISKYRPNATQTAQQTGAGVTFREFVQYLLDVQRPVRMDIHWEPVSQLCSPCILGYSFIGRFERLQEEAGFLLQSIGAPRNLTFPNLKDRNPGAERTSPSITQKYFAQLSAVERQRIFDFYYMDYLMFNYSKPFLDLH